jgi:hypothetical protein
MKRVSTKAILIGGIVDIGSSSVLGILLGVLIAARLDLTHMPKDQLANALKAAINGSIPLRAAEIALGLLCSALGGYAAARIAKHDELLNGALSACLCVALGIWSIASGTAYFSLLMELLMLVSAPVFAFLGGYIRLRQRARTGEFATSHG